MLYTSTRGISGLVPSAAAIKKGLAADGGLYVPINLPRFSLSDLEKMCSFSYLHLASEILGLFLTDFSHRELEDALEAAYTKEKFGDEPVPIHMINNKLAIMELWHGPTCAFKDIALQLLPHLLTLSAKKTGENSEIVILVATSGDTGKAALEGFKNVPGTRIVVFYPNDGVSDVQKRQMITTDGDNVKVIAVDGNFDDCQRGVKEIFNDEQFAKDLRDKGFVLSSANSINWGRLVPQIVYYFKAYSYLVETQNIEFGEKVNFVVPTGNFGDILAGFYAKCMGLPVNKLICASNSNNVLTDFIQKGIYDRKRNFYKTISPSMDILVSSNLERLLYYLTKSDPDKVAEYMDELNDSGKYTVNNVEARKLKEHFYASWADENKTKEQIQLMYMVNNYIVDPHTAVALSVLNNYQRDNPKDNFVNVVLSTASVFKFSGAAFGALENDATIADSVEIMNKLSEKIKVKVPKRLSGVTEKPILHSDVVKYEDMRSAVKGFLGV